MPGGIGQVSTSARSAGTGRDRGVSRFSTPNEIFFHLDARHVYFDSEAGQLYFVDAPHGLIATTVQRACHGMNVVPTIQQLHLDVHGLFAGARRVALGPREANTVLTALRLVGVGATRR